MLFKKSNIPTAKDTIADSYLEAIKEHREKIRAKTREIQECLGAETPCAEQAKPEVKSDDQNHIL